MAQSFGKLTHHPGQGKNVLSGAIPQLSRRAAYPGVQHQLAAGGMIKDGARQNDALLAEAPFQAGYPFALLKAHALPEAATLVY